MESSGAGHPVPADHSDRRYTFYKVKPSLPPLPAESKKLSRRADAVPWPQKQKPPAFIK